ncbi:hypothetical protein [Paraburkholderia sp. GAS334]|uniref:hypothetical protein n=1 Tax=Paraburkholderia sp. GAS334 TaxID=3035131 RepID=UPI003D1E1CB4
MPNITEELLDALRSHQKTATSKWKESSKAKGHSQAEIMAEDDDGNVYRIYTRQSTIIADNFSAGIVWLAKDGSSVPLARYNGSDHAHSNPIEGNEFAFVCHIHTATERYGSSSKPDKYAEETDRYTTLAGALTALLQDYNVVEADTVSGQACLI